jgi:hypothetical protein
MTVRAKLQLTEITTRIGDQKTVTFEARFEDTIPEDQRFQRYTPYAKSSMTIDNPAALEQFKLGEHYYLDFKRVEAAPAPSSVTLLACCRKPNPHMYGWCDRCHNHRSPTMQRGVQHGYSPRKARR